MRGADAILHLTVNGGPTQRDDQEAGKLDREMSAIYRLFGGKAATKPYKSLLHGILDVAQGDPEGAILHLTSDKPLLVAAASAALS